MTSKDRAADYVMGALSAEERAAGRARGGSGPGNRRARSTR